MLLSSLEICGARPGPALPARASLQGKGEGSTAQKEDSESRATAVLGSAAPVCLLAFRDPQCLRMTESPRHASLRPLRSRIDFLSKKVFLIVRSLRYDPNPQGEYEQGLDSGLGCLFATPGHELRHWSWGFLGFLVIVREPCDLILLAVVYLLASLPVLI